jgi:hypothetical protein
MSLGTGENTCQCMNCGEYCQSVYAFDRHQHLTKTGRVICLTDAEMREKGWRVNDHGRWVTEAMPTMPVFTAGKIRHAAKG